MGIAIGERGTTDMGDEESEWSSGCEAGVLVGVEDVANDMAGDTARRFVGCPYGSNRSSLVSIRRERKRREK